MEETEEEVRTSLEEGTRWQTSLSFSRSAGPAGAGLSEPVL